MRRAIRIAGSESKLADIIGTSPQLVRYWSKKAKRGAAAEFVIKIEQATGVSRHELRGDIYPREEAA